MFQVLPALNGRLTGMAFRVPTPNVRETGHAPGCSVFRRARHWQGRSQQPAGQAVRHASHRPSPDPLPGRLPQLPVASAAGACGGTPTPRLVTRTTPLLQRPNNQQTTSHHSCVDSGCEQVSVVDLTCNLETETSYEAIMAELERASKEELKGILG